MGRRLMAAYARLLGDRRFALLWGGATISMLGDALTWVSLVWLTFELGGTAADVGILAVCYTAPVIVGGLAAGVLLDRFDRRRLLIADNAIRGVAVLSVPVASALGVLGQAQLDVVASVYGLLYMISLAGFPSIIPDIVATDDLSTANAMESLSFAIGGVVGPATGGLLIGIIGASNNLAIDALTYFVFVACLTALRLPARKVPADSAATGGVGIESGLRPALHFVRRTPAILAITLMYMALNIGEGMLTVALPTFAREVVDAGAIGYGLLVSAFTVGSLAGALAVGAVRWRWPLGRSLSAAALAAGLVAALLALEPPLGGAALILFTMGLCASPLTIWAQTIRMRLIPPELRGRVFAFLRTLIQSTPPIGGLAAGALLAGRALGADGIGGATALVFLLVALLTAVPGAIGLVHPALGRVATAEPASTLASASESAAPDLHGGDRAA